MNENEDLIAWIPSADAVRTKLNETLRYVRRLRIVLRAAEESERLDRKEEKQAGKNVGVKS